MNNKVFLEIGSKQFISNVNSVEKNKATKYIVGGMDDCQEKTKRTKVTHEKENLFIYSKKNLTVI